MKPSSKSKRREMAQAEYRASRAFFAGVREAEQKNQAPTNQRGSDQSLR